MKNACCEVVQYALSSNNSYVLYVQNGLCLTGTNASKCTHREKKLQGIKWVKVNDTLRDSIFLLLCTRFPFELDRLLPLCYFSVSHSFILCMHFFSGFWFASFHIKIEVPFDTLMHFPPTIFATRTNTTLKTYKQNKIGEGKKMHRSACGR